MLRAPQVFGKPAQLILLVLAITVTFVGRIAALEAEAVAAAQSYFDKIDRRDYEAAYDRFAEVSKAVIPFSTWLMITKKTGPAVSRRYNRTVVYDLPSGRLTAVEFDGVSENGDALCGYIVVDADGLVVRVETTRIPGKDKAAIAESLAELPGCQN